ncbi:MAG: hypothetical protein KME57_06300 [Scytonema hyalinum WJT4-NPBG1]|nr:hypothetical protein [Scytonema hyalinum WJT4-NPBG1]
MIKIGEKQAHQLRPILEKVLNSVRACSSPVKPVGRQERTLGATSKGALPYKKQPSPLTEAGEA